MHKEIDEMSKNPPSSTVKAAGCKSPPWVPEKRIAAIRCLSVKTIVTARVSPEL